MDIFEYIAVAFPAIFVILNPFSALTSFLALTTSKTEEQKHNIAKRACLTAFITLISFILFGHIIFKAFGISMPAFRIAGGIIVFLIGLNMLQHKPLRMKQTDEEMQESLTKTDVAIIPLGIPLMSGPGSITTAMVLMMEARNPFEIVGLILSCAATCLIFYFILNNSTRFMKYLSLTVAGIMTRVMGLFLSVIAIQFIINGIKELLPIFAKVLNS